LCSVAALRRAVAKALLAFGEQRGGLSMLLGAKKPILLLTIVPAITAENRASGV
jgi:hypothetical protein